MATHHFLTGMHTAVESSDRGKARRVYVHRSRDKQQVSTVVQASDKRKGWIWAHKQLWGLGSWNALLWFHNIPYCVHTTVEAGDGGFGWEHACRPLGLVAEEPSGVGHLQEMAWNLGPQATWRPWLLCSSVAVRFCHG